MEVFYQHEEQGIMIWAGGSSIITDTSIIKKSTIDIDKFPSVRKVILVWSGEVSGRTDDAHSVQFINQTGRPMAAIK